MKIMPAALALQDIVTFKVSPRVFGSKIFYSRKASGVKLEIKGCFLNANYIGNRNNLVFNDFCGLGAESDVSEF